MFLASPDGEKALCPCCPPLGEVFCRALLVTVSKTALTHIINHFLLDGGRIGGVWAGHILEDLSATKDSSGDTSHSFCCLVSSFYFPTFWREERLSDTCNALWCWEQPWKCKISHSNSKLYSIRYI